MEHYRDVRRMSMDENQMKEIEEMENIKVDHSYTCLLYTSALQQEAISFFV